MKHANQLTQNPGGDASMLLGWVAIGTMAVWMIAMARLVLTMVPVASQSILESVRF